MAFSISLPVSTYYSKNREIDKWLLDNCAEVSNSIRHPYALFGGGIPVIVITFKDRELACLFKLTWC